MRVFDELVPLLLQILASHREMDEDMHEQQNVIVQLLITLACQVPMVSFASVPNLASASAFPPETAGPRFASLTFQAGRRWRVRHSQVCRALVCLQISVPALLEMADLALSGNKPEALKRLQADAARFCQPWQPQLNRPSKLPVKQVPHAKYRSHSPFIRTVYSPI